MLADRGERHSFISVLVIVTLSVTSVRNLVFVLIEIDFCQAVGLKYCVGLV